MQPQDDGYNPFVKLMQDQDEQFFKTFPEARIDMMQKRWELQNSLTDPLYGHVYDHNLPTECPSPHYQPLATDCSSPGSSSSFGSHPGTGTGFSLNVCSPHGGNSDTSGYYPTAAFNHLLGPSLQPDSQSASSLPEPRMGFSATHQNSFHSSSLSAAVIPIDRGNRPSRLGQGHGSDRQNQEQPQIPLVPIVPSNNRPPVQWHPRSLPYYHQVNSPASSSGWSEPPPMASLDDTPGHSQPHHHLNGFVVPSNIPAGHALSVSYPRHTPALIHHHRRYDSSSSSNTQASYSAPATVQQFHMAGPPASYGTDASFNSTWLQQERQSSLNPGPDHSPSPSVSVESPNSIESDAQPVATPPAIVAQPSSRGTLTNSGNKSAKKNGDKKPPLACLFCRGRKIACGPPVPGGDGHTCNQCERRHLHCEYPAESRRGMRKKRSASHLDPDGRETKRSSSKSQRTRR